MNDAVPTKPRALAFQGHRRPIEADPDLFLCEVGRGTLFRVRLPVSTSNSERE